MINDTLKQILQSPNGKEFAQWYTSQNNDITTFKDLRFEQQLGVYLMYLETMWGFSVIADNTGYISYYTSGFGNSNKTLLSERFKTHNFYHIHSFEGEIKDTMSYYSMGIIQLFNNLDIPF